mmetsp:Transcript_55450/g.159454  ORF Transcript_55450/g.159454 Transcript_55450/m.159454 type:complete len:449 (-) Transcript_55450:136-1482(-)
MPAKYFQAESLGSRTSSVASLKDVLLEREVDLPEVDLTDVVLTSSSSSHPSGASSSTAAALPVALPAPPKCSQDANRNDEYYETASTSASEFEEQELPEVEDSDEEHKIGLSAPEPHPAAAAAAVACTESSGGSLAVAAPKARWADLEEESDEEREETPAATPEVASKESRGADLSTPDKEISSHPVPVPAAATQAATASSSSSSAASDPPTSIRNANEEMSSELKNSVDEWTVWEAQGEPKKWPKRSTWWSQQEQQHEVQWGTKAATWRASRSQKDWWGSSNGAGSNWQSTQQQPRGSRATDSGRSQQADRHGGAAYSSACSSTWAAKPQCQYFIGIEEDAKFKVTCRILGSHGKHMKEIAQATGAKLRLRGQGSGFLEGDERLESTDELMLCLSAQDWESYQEAVRLVNELLNGIYEQYCAFCGEIGGVAPHLEISMHEGPRPGSR